MLPVGKEEGAQDANAVSHGMGSGVPQGRYHEGIITLGFLEEHWHFAKQNWFRKVGGASCIFVTCIRAYRRLLKIETIATYQHFTILEGYLCIMK